MQLVAVEIRRQLVKAEVVQVVIASLRSLPESHSAQVDPDCYPDLQPVIAAGEELDAAAQSPVELGVAPLEQVPHLVTSELFKAEHIGLNHPHFIPSMVLMVPY